MSRHALRLSILGCLTLLLAFVIISDITPLLRGPNPGSDVWYWPYQLRPIARWPLPILAALLPVGATAWWMKRPEKTRIALVALVLSNLLLQLAIVYAERPSVLAELVDRTLSEGTTSYFQPAAEITNLHDFLTDYPQKMAQFANDHARTHPPGLILLNLLLIRAFSAVPATAEFVAQQIRPLRCIDLWLLERPAAIVAALGAASLLPLLVGALTILPGYLLARRLLPAAASRIATALIAALPALLIFAPNNVQIDAFLTVTIFLSIYLGMRRQNARFFFTGGLLLSLATFFSLGNAVLLLPLAIFAAGYYWSQFKDANEPWDKPSDWRGWFRLKIWGRLLAFLLGTAALWLIFWIGWGVRPWEVARVGMEQHYLLVTAERSYSRWLVYNLIDLLVYAGLPLIIGFLGFAVVSRPRAIKPITGLGIGVAALILFLDLSGSTRGEVGRLWLFFMPLMVLPAAAFLERTFHAPLPLVGFQLIIALSLGLTWRPIAAVIVVAQQPDMATTLAPDSELNLTFIEPHSQKELMRLTGFALNDDGAKPGGQLELTLFWEATRPAQRPYTVFNHLVNDKGELVAQQDNWPVQGQWPPSCWRDGDQIVDPYVIDLPTDLAPGEYRLLTGFYDAANFNRLTLADGQDAAQLATITVP